MRKNLRSGIDVEFAFASLPKHNEAPADQQASVGHMPPTAVSDDNVDAPPPAGPSGTKLTIKKLMRPLAGAAYRLLKPLLRPIAFRTRRYLSEALLQDVREEISRSTAANLHKVEVIRHLVHQDVLSSQHSTHKELQKTAANTVQELQKTAANIVQELQKVQASLHRDVLAAQLAATAQIREANAATAEAVNAATKHFRENALASQQAVAASARSVEVSRQATAEATQQLVAHVGGITERLDRIELYSYATARRIVVNCGGEAVLVKTEAGFVLCNEHDHALLACLVDTGELERGTRLLIEKLLNPGDCFVDVGANIGMHTLAAARAMGGHGKIIAFEPFGPTKQLLERTIWLNGFSLMTDIHQAAVSNEAGLHQLFLGAASGHHSIFPLDEDTGMDAPPVEVPLVRLSDIIPATQNVQLLKIDVEGAELQVLESATPVIENNPDLAIIVEFGPAHLARTGVTPTDWFQAFARYDMQYRAINAMTGALEQWELDQLLACDSVNLLFSREESSVWEKLAT
ncbi:FkbM family methyltransferase [Burkholderia anthina]|uniref:FkbM family methyltransferase n=1 Tax=Burkholderia anthina TaxID=179879 RepID=UPI000F5FA54C|nr:FkbM family methyltransferase [Burkholderia anthina]RQX84314.1 FkbM family methyltransferase [Burkholderia anthina]